MSKVGGIDADKLRSYIERIERLEEERRSLAADIKDIKAEAKSSGFDVKVINALLKERRMDAAEVERIEVEKDVYRRALGMMADTPLGESALERVAQQRDPSGDFSVSLDKKHVGILRSAAKSLRNREGDNADLAVPMEQLHQATVDLELDRRGLERIAH
jgi:uncharacterized protein (UPF0335 family)